MNNHDQYPGRQWWERLEMWEDWLKGHIWYNVDGVEIEGIITRERLTYEAAIEQIKSSRKQMLPGMTWGNYWEYGWFKTQWTVRGQETDLSCSSRRRDACLGQWTGERSH